MTGFGTTGNGGYAVALVDGEVLQEVRRNLGGGDERAWRSVVAGFRSEAERQLARLAAAAGGTDAERLRELAVCLRQEAWAVAAARVAALCRALEGLGQNGSIGEAIDIVDELSRTLDATLAALGATRGAA